MIVNLLHVYYDVYMYTPRLLTQYFSILKKKVEVRVQSA